MKRQLSQIAAVQPLSLHRRVPAPKIKLAETDVQFVGDCLRFVCEFDACRQLSMAPLPDPNKQDFTAMEAALVVTMAVKRVVRDISSTDQDMRTALGHIFHGMEGFDDWIILREDFMERALRVREDAAKLFPPPKPPANSWDSIYQLGARSSIRFSYSEIGNKSPQPSADVSTCARFAFYQLPVERNDVTVTAMTVAVLDKDNVVVFLDRALMLSYKCGPTCTRHKFVLSKTGFVRYLDEDCLVRDWDHHIPTWDFVTE